MVSNVAPYDHYSHNEDLLKSVTIFFQEADFKNDFKHYDKVPIE